MKIKYKKGSTVRMYAISRNTYIYFNFENNDTIFETYAV